MKGLADIKPAIEKMKSKPCVTDLRSHTYLSTYPHILKFCEQVDCFDDSSFRQIVLMVYGWMPRVLRVDSRYVQDAIQSANNVMTLSKDNLKSAETDLKNIAECLHSHVGASKTLHFIRPDVFPIWDSKIQAFLGLPNNYNEMTKSKNYFDYAERVHAITLSKGFDEFYSDYSDAFGHRLLQSNIEQYQVSDIRAVESCAFELAEI